MKSVCVVSKQVMSEKEFDVKNVVTRSKEDQLDPQNGCFYTSECLFTLPVPEEVGVYNYTVRVAAQPKQPAGQLYYGTVEGLL